MTGNSSSNKRIVFCLKLWIKELKKDKNWHKKKADSWLINTVENEILNGEYCSDEEYQNDR